MPLHPEEYWTGEPERRAEAEERRVQFLRERARFERRLALLFACFVLVAAWGLVALAGLVRGLMEKGLVGR